MPYQYSFFNEQYRRWMRATGATMRIVLNPGESIEVDWAGDAMSFGDPVNGEPTSAWLFVAALSYSAYSYSRPSRTWRCRRASTRTCMPSSTSGVSDDCSFRIMFRGT